MRRQTARIGVVLLSAIVILAVTVVQPGLRTGLRLGVAGPYTDASLSAARDAGVDDVLIEVAWREAEPTAGRLDEAYLRDISEQVRSARARGFEVALNTGIHEAPDWLLREPGARFLDQFGTTYDEMAIPNLVFGEQFRPLAESYLTRLFDRLGLDFALVRVGGGPLGELGYPASRDPAGRIRNSYWAFDQNASRNNPVPGWQPGSPSPDGEARTFLDWYLDALVDYQNWQVEAVRSAGYRGLVAVLYPSHGMRPGDGDAAVSNDLDGTSSPERNGEVQRGYDFSRQIRALVDDRTAVYGTWGEEEEIVEYLAGLALQTGHPVMAENSGANSAVEIDRALRTAVRNGLSAFWLIRAPDLICDCRGQATLEDVTRTLDSLGGRASRARGRRRLRRTSGGASRPG
jgi:hypothetical protein